MEHLILLELRELNKKQQLANEIAYQQLKTAIASTGLQLERHPGSPLHTIMAEFNERLGR